MLLCVKNNALFCHLITVLSIYFCNRFGIISTWSRQGAETEKEDREMINKNLTITTAKIIANVILPHSIGTVESRILDAQLANPKAFEILRNNQIALMRAGSFEKAELVARDLIA